MEKTEPTLVPEWLKSSGGFTGVGNANHHLSPSSLHSDDHFVSKHARKNSSLSSDYDIGHSFASDRTTSSYFRQSSGSNGSTHLRTYGSFGRSLRDRDWEKDINNLHDTDKTVFGDHRHYDHSDPLDSILPSRFEKEILRRSQSMLTGKRGDMWPRKVAGDLTNTNRSNHSNGNGLLTGGSAYKTAFERDFPSLGNEERQVGSEIGRVSSPGLSTAGQTQTSNSTVIGSEGWTSALVEVPVNTGSGCTTSTQQNVSVTTASVASTMTTGPNMAETLTHGPSRELTGFNMAETLTHGPSRVRTRPQLTVGTQRLEELAIKQSRQLIPVTPSMPKSLAISPSEKSKAKFGQQQHPLHTVNHARGGPARSDSPKTINEGRLQVLKSSRELNGSSSTTKDSLSPTNGNKATNGQLGTQLAAGSAPLRSSSNSPNFSAAERNPGSFRGTIEKKQTPQAQSRNDFFNLLKKKSSTNSSAAAPDPCASFSPTVLEKSDEVDTENSSAPVTLQVGDVPSSESAVSNYSTNNRDETTHNGDHDMSHECISNGETYSGPNVIYWSYEEEFAFMRSLGWEENAGEDEEGLTKEEIHDFLKEYVKLRPSSKRFERMWQAVMPLNSQDECCDGASTGTGSSDSESKS